MTHQNRIQTLPGIYPHIVNIQPANRARGKDYIGSGSTQHGEQFVLKQGGTIGAAEFIGAGLCRVIGIPCCDPTVVTIEGHGNKQPVFGSRLEHGVVEFQHGNIAKWSSITKQCSNIGAFSALLAIDLATGNDDRHWDNWMVQQGSTGLNTVSYCLRALDFSRAWPVCQPPQEPLKHQSPNTWQSTKDWEVLGIPYDQSVFYDASSQIGSLTDAWLHSVLEPLAEVFLKHNEIDQLCQWWRCSWKAQVIDTIDALDHGSRP